MPPILLLIVMLFAPRMVPDFSSWADETGLRYLPWALLAAAGGLGLCFGQSRILLCAILIAVATYSVERFLFREPALEAQASAVLLALLAVLPGMALLYLLGEKGLLTEHGALRIGIVLLGCMVTAWLPNHPDILDSLWGRYTPLLSVISEGIALPKIVVAQLLVCVPLLFIGKQHESPLLGPMMAITMLFFLLAMNCRTTFWSESQQHGGLLLLTSGTGAALIWAVLEGAWRNANVDELTQLPARRALKHHLSRLGADCTIAILDIDHFKKVNDRYGHDVGDQVLRFVATHLQKHAPGVAYRYGGEEFVIVCEGEDHNEHAEAIAALRESLGTLKFRLRGKARPRRRPESPDPGDRGSAGSIKITASVGVAISENGDLSPAELIKLADKALYRAKKAGRDRLSRTGWKSK